MKALARLVQTPDVTQELATVERVTGDALEVRTQYGRESARRAASCLIAPAAQDEVLLVRTPDGRLFVAAVLEREDESQTEIAVDGELRLHASERLSLSSAELKVEARQGRLTFGSLAMVATSLMSRIETVRLFAESIESVCDRLAQTARHHYRKVTELDHLRAERVDYRANQEMGLRAEHIVARARKLAKVDGEQIHIG